MQTLKAVGWSGPGLGTGCEQRLGPVAAAWNRQALLNIVRVSRLSSAKEGAPFFFLFVLPPQLALGELRLLPHLPLPPARRMLVDGGDPPLLLFKLLLLCR